MSIRPPRVRMITFHSCHRLIYCRRFVQYRTLLCLASSSVSIQPHMRFLSVSASVCVRLPSDSTSRWTPLSFTNSSYCQVCSGLSPPSYHPCRAHQKKGWSQMRPALFSIIRHALSQMRSDSQKSPPKLILRHGQKTTVLVISS